MKYHIVLHLILLISVYSGTAYADQVVCPDQPSITVIPKHNSDVHRICYASAKTLPILAKYSLLPKRQITIEIIDSGINHRGYEAYGSYDIRSDRIQMISYSAIANSKDSPEMYDEAFDEVHYYGAVAHEITHAVFHHHSTGMSPGPAPQEYLAHAVQLSVLPQARRETIINTMDVSAWLSGDAISDIYMALEPGKFAVKSYKHLQSLEDPQEFISILLNSKWFYVYIP